ncbi:MAG: hypothetical protein JSS02_12500 [Planctomycetes bacterium]|nr:hypothetical protein [Planctomycetota bacterium]
MDLPTCPACKQSVLDDDAVDCPFCGAPLKGGAAPARPAPAARGSAPAAPGKPAPAKPGAATGSKSSAGGSATGKSAATPAGPAEDDPFGVDPSIAANAIPVSPTPGAGKSIEVTCPMCETKGYVSPKAAGKMVKCCNPKCMVPLFSGPPLPKKEVVVKEQPKKKLPWLYIAGGVGFAVIAGVSIWFMQDQGISELPPSENVYVPGQGNSNGMNSGDEGTQTTQATTPQKTQPDANSARDDLTKQALSRILEVSSNIRQERKPMWRRLAITAYTFANEPQKAREQLNLLEKATNQSPYEGIPPLVAMAWRSAGNAGEMQKTVEEALALAEKLPPRGRFATEAALGLAPLLVLAGKADQAHALLAEHRSEAPLEQFAAAMRISIEDHSFNLDRPYIGRSVGYWQFPLETGVTLSLAAHGRWDEALGWANQLTDAVARTEARTAWAESLLHSSGANADAKVLERARSVGTDMNPAGQARLLARLAAVRAEQGDRAGAAQLLSEAGTILKSFPKSESIVVEGAKPLLDLKLPDANSLKQMALAAADVACVQARTGDRAAMEQVELALRLAGAIGPAINPTQERRRQVGDTAKIGAELKKALALKKDDEIRRAVTQYKLKLSEVEGAAANRFQIETVVLQAAANAGLHSQVWDVLERYDRKPAKEHQPLIATHLSYLVAQRFAEAGDAGRSDEIQQAVQSRVDPADPEIIKLVVEHLLATGDVARCVARLNGAVTPNGHLHETVLRLATRLAQSGKNVEAVTFSNSISDPTLKEECLYFTAVGAAIKGAGPAYWKAAKDVGLGPNESTAVGAGLVVGLNQTAAQ